MDKRTRATIGDVTPSTLAIAQRVLEHLEERGTPLPHQRRLQHRHLPPPGANPAAVTDAFLRHATGGCPAVMRQDI